MRRCRSQAGFTLVEVLVALTITVIGLLGLMSIHTTTLHGNRNSSRAAEATTLAQRTMEELRTMTVDGGPGSIVDTYGPLPLTDHFLDTVAGRAGITFKRSFSVEELGSVSSNLVRLHVSVRWADGGDDPDTAPEITRHEMTLELIRTKQELL